MKKIAMLAAGIFLATSALARPPGPPPGGHRPPPPHHGHAWGALAIGLGVGSLFALASSPRTTTYYTTPAYTTTYTTTYGVPTYTTTTTTYAPAPTVSYVPVVQTPQPVYVEKEPTKLFCRSKNNFYPKVQSCAEGWLEVVNR